MGSGPAALVAALAVFAAGAGWAGCAPGELELRDGAGRIAGFSVEIARTPAERALGLMNRKHLPAGSGMLFVFQPPQHAWFWMKDTLIPLDMIFADRAGVVRVVHAGARPGDETPIDGGPNVAYVLEINGGLATKLGIVPGAEMRSAEMAQDPLAWPCE